MTMELLFQLVVKFVKYMADSGANSIRFFRWFWNFLKEEKVFFQLFYSDFFTFYIFPNGIYIFSQYRSAEF